MSREKELARKRVKLRLELGRQRRRRAKKLDVPLPSLYPKQEEIKKAAKRYNVLDIGRRAGKTYLGVHLALEAASSGELVGWFSPTYKYLLDVWRDLERPSRGIASRINATERRIEFPNGGMIEAWTLENSDAGRGRRYHVAIVDEAAMVGNLLTAWNEAISPTLADFQGTAWFLSTPKGLNFFHDLWLRGQDSENYPNWTSWLLPSSVNPFLPPKEIEEARKSLPEMTFRQEFLAEFISSDGAVLRNVDAVLNAPETLPSDHKGHFLVAGVDWGRTHDFTAASLFCCHCGHEVALDRFNQIGWDFQRGRLLALFSKWGVREVCVETNSIGGPNLEALRKQMPDDMYAVGFETTSKTKGPMIQALALAIEQAKLRLLSNTIARHELVSYEAEVLSSGYTRYGAPEGGWDDTVIARGLAWHKAKSRTPYPKSENEKIESALPAGWRAENTPATVGSWEYDGWMMAREARKTEIEEAMKKAGAGLDDPWNPQGALKNVSTWEES
jgi:hypothetical protein